MAELLQLGLAAIPQISLFAAMFLAPALVLLFVPGWRSFWAVSAIMWALLMLPLLPRVFPQLWELLQLWKIMPTGGEDSVIGWMFVLFGFPIWSVGVAVALIVMALKSARLQGLPRSKENS